MPATNTLQADPAAPPRVTVVMPGDVPALMSAMAVGDKRAAQLVQPVLSLAARVRSKKGGGSTCPCCGGRISGPFATVLIHRAGSAEPSLAAAICADCASTAEEVAAASEALARRIWEGG
jgi:bacterioferritin-associated ferredoxin